MFRTFTLLTSLLLCGLGPGAAVAQEIPTAQQFLSSVVVLQDGDTLRGPLVLRQDLDLLLITMPDKTIRTVPALAVRTFAVRGELIQPTGLGTNRPIRRRWFDVQRARPFLVYPWNRGQETAPATAPAFFERLNGGPVILLRRQRLVQRTAPLPDNGSLPPSVPVQAVRRLAPTYTDVQEQYYLATPEGAVVALRRPRRDLLAYFAAEAEAIEEYARQKGFSYTDGYHLARLVDFANELRRPVQ